MIFTQLSVSVGAEQHIRKARSAFDGLLRDAIRRVRSLDIDVRDVFVDMNNQIVLRPEEGEVVICEVKGVFKSTAADEVMRKRILEEIEKTFRDFFGAETRLIIIVSELHVGRVFDSCPTPEGESILVRRGDEKK